MLWFCEHARIGDRMRGYGGNGGNDEYERGEGHGEGEVHGLTLWGNKVDNAVGCGLDHCLQLCGGIRLVSENLQERSGEVHV